VTLARSGDLVAAAAARGGAVAAVNAITLEHAEAIVGAASATGAGVIVQLSENATRFHGGDPRPILAAVHALAEAADAPVALHLDHVQDAALLDRALAIAGGVGLASVMVDAARLDYEANVAETAAFTARAQALGIWVEAELGEVGGKDGAHAPGVRTDPAEAAAFVAATGVDALAVAVGSSHAMTSRTAALDLDLVCRLAAAVPVPLVLHGSSGVPDETLVAAAGAGIRKINVGTALNVVGTAALRAALAERPDAVDPRGPLAAARDAMRAEVERLLRLLP
jgi:fructose-bisphosphate aldolase, class II